MRTKDIIAGLQILLKYYDNPDGFHCGAEHDEFCAYATDKSLSTEDVRKMVELGWHQEPEDFPFGERDWAIKDYDPEESWVAYV